MEKKPNDKPTEDLKAARDKANDPKIKEVINKKLDQVTKPFNK